MVKNYFVFGYGQQHEGRFHVIEAETAVQARQQMFERFGAKWSAQYSEAEWYNEDGISQEEEYNLREIK